jgi:hypothetical protein
MLLWPLAFVLLHGRQHSTSAEQQQQQQQQQLL